MVDLWHLSDEPVVSGPFFWLLTQQQRILAGGLGLPLSVISGSALDHPVSNPVNYLEPAFFVVDESTDLKSIAISEADTGGMVCGHSLAPLLMVNMIRHFSVYARSA
jgi:hypothetical protein